MKLSVLKKKIIKDQIEFNTEVGMSVSDLKEFKKTITRDINECKDIFDLIECLGNYGYDNQGAIHIIASYLIK